MKNRRRRFPLFIDMSDHRILVVGGGRIATRRIKVLLDFVEDITVVSPAITPELERLVEEGRLRWQEKEFQRDMLESYDMVLAATEDKELNSLVGRMCKHCGIMVNVASDQNLCDFHFPGIVIADEVTVGINASGEDHEKIVALREKIQEIL